MVGSAAAVVVVVAVRGVGVRWVDHVGAAPCEGGLQGLVKDEALVGGALTCSPSEVFCGEGDVEEGVEPCAR